jgi:hypothetical protein
LSASPVIVPAIPITATPRSVPGKARTGIEAAPSKTRAGTGTESRSGSGTGKGLPISGPGKVVGFVPKGKLGNPQYFHVCGLRSAGFGPLKFGEFTDITVKGNRGIFLKAVHKSNEAVETCGKVHRISGLKGDVPVYQCEFSTHRNGLRRGTSPPGLGGGFRFWPVSAILLVLGKSPDCDERHHGNQKYLFHIKPLIPVLIYRYCGKEHHSTG